MVEDRPQIPAELRRRVLVEAGHRCAIPTCRHIEVDVHHIVPWLKCREHAYENLIALCPNCHRRAGRSEIDRKSLRMYKANLRCAHDKFSQFEVDMLFELHKCGSRGTLWPTYLMLLLKRLFDAGYLERQETRPGEIAFQERGMKMRISPDLLLITEAGRAFVEDLGAQWSEQASPDEDRPSELGGV